jgi:hypothetical protein
MVDLLVLTMLLILIFYITLSQRGGQLHSAIPISKCSVVRIAVSVVSDTMMHCCKTDLVSLRIKIFKLK